ncbi:MAG: OmpA family protein [Elusimicrobia bacterium]|nr:OmpA family protein [Elusimicrobiota bacterium]
MKIIFAKKSSLFIFLWFILMFFYGDIISSQTGSRGGPRLSRSMEQAIQLYNEGEDNDAMNRFMDILVKGSPAEKALANEYINKITLRMNTGLIPVKDAADAVPIQAVKQETRKSGADIYEEAAKPQYEPETRDKKELAAEKITAGIKEIRRNLLLELQKYNGIKIFVPTGEDMPNAVSINSDYIFAIEPGKETVFRTGAGKMLSGLSGLIFTLGNASCLIIPEGSVGGDIKIADIRRAIALSSYLTGRGISNARIDVHLMGSDLRLPKELTVVGGIILLFDYKKELRLTQTEDTRAKGPKVSLGVFPTAISVYNNEGAIIEFSVFESPDKEPPTWRFQIFNLQPDNTLLLIQEINGNGHQYHQSFWNGRKDFFGAAYENGKYLFSITASDVRGNESSMRKMLLLKSQSGQETETSSKEKAGAPKKKEIGKVLSGKTEKEASPAEKGTRKSVKLAPSKSGALKTAKKTPVSKPSAPVSSKPEPTQDETAPVSDADQTEFSGQVIYKIYFRDGSSSITPNSERKLSQVADNMNLYPMAKVKLTGYAYSGEPNSETVAQNRANFVAGVLSNKYGITKQRIEIHTRISETPKSIVEIKMLGKE